MIITIKGANFAGSNIGTLSSYTVRFSGNGVSGSPTSIAKNEEGTQASANYVGTITVSSSYTYKSVSSVTVNGTALSTSDYTVSGMNITIPANKITGNVVITVATEKVNTEPEEPTMYTFTINPTPSNATVTLTAPGHSQLGKSITVPANTSVSWKVTASGYTEQKGTHTVTKTETKNVTLDATSIENQIDLGTINKNQWIKFENGENQSLNAWMSTADYIAIPDGVTSIHSDDITAFRHGGANTTPYAFYDVDKNYISGVDMETIPEDTTGVSNTGAWRNSLTYDVPENAAYVRICWTNGGYKHMTTGVRTPLTSPIVQWVY